jgi:hypothetical protein
MGVAVDRSARNPTTVLVRPALAIMLNWPGLSLLARAVS